MYRKHHWKTNVPRLPSDCFRIRFFRKKKQKTPEKPSDFFGIFVDTSSSWGMVFVGGFSRNTLITHMYIYIPKHSIRISMVCLPTWMVNLYATCRWIYHTLSMWDYISLQPKPTSKLINTYNPPGGHVYLETPRVNPRLPRSWLRRNRLSGVTKPTTPGWWKYAFINFYDLGVPGGSWLKEISSYIITYPAVSIHLDKQNSPHSHWIAVNFSVDVLCYEPIISLKSWYHDIKSN